MVFLLHTLEYTRPVESGHFMCYRKRTIPLLLAGPFLWPNRVVGKSLKWALLSLAAFVALAAMALFLWARPDAKPRLDGVYTRLVQEKRFDELLSYLSRQQFFLTLAAPLGSGKNNLSYVHYLKGKTHYEKMEALKQSEEWQKYYKTAGQLYQAIHLELNRALDFDRSSRLDVQAAYMDWRMYVERNSVLKTSEAFTYFKSILARYVERTNDIEFLKTTADALGNEGDLYPQVLYAQYVRAMLDRGKGPGFFFDLIDRGLGDGNENLVKSTVNAYVAGLLSQGLSQRNAQILRHLFSKLYTASRHEAERIRRKEPERYMEIADLDYLYDDIIWNVKAVLAEDDKTVAVDHFLFLMGAAYYEKFMFDPAAGAFEKIVFEYPSSLYWERSVNYAAASRGANRSGFAPGYIQFTNKVYYKYPNRPIAPELLISLGLYYEIHGDPKNAVLEYNEILAHYPNSDVVLSLAMERMMEIQTATGYTIRDGKVIRLERANVTT